MSTSFFVAADWLAEHIDDPQIQILDARMAPAGISPARFFLISKRCLTTPARCRI